MKKLLFPVVALFAAVTAFAGTGAEALLEKYVEDFNAADEERYRNAYPNAKALEFLRDNIPLFTCPDKDIERTYYFRWWTFRKHLRHDLGVWTVSEFLPDVCWAKAGNTIVCPAGHHFREGRWLRDRRYLDDLSRFWLADERSEGHRCGYTSWLYTGVCGYAEVSGHDALAEELLDAAVRYYRRWEHGWLRRSWPELEPFPMGALERDDGLFYSIDCAEGTEVSLGGNGLKPLCNSALWSEANAIAKTARRLGKTALAEEFEAKAALTASNFVKTCWSTNLSFFVTADFNAKQRPVRELHGYAPWYFGMPTEGRAADWKQLFDRNGFRGLTGFSFPERRAEGFQVQYTGHACQWNGPSWPFATAVALTAYANDLKAREAGPDRFAEALHIYAAQHRRVFVDEKGKVRMIPWIDENRHPDNEDWLCRTMRLEDAHQDGRRFDERGKDYNHSTFCDLVISGLVGFTPNGAKGFSVVPLVPADWEYFTLENLDYRGHRVDIAYRRGEGLSVWVDGTLEVKSEKLKVKSEWRSEK